MRELIKGKKFDDQMKINAFLNTVKQKFNVNRNMRQVLHINELCIDGNNLRRNHIFGHPILQREFLKFKREIKKNLKTIKQKDKLRKMKILKNFRKKC